MDETEYRRSVAKEGYGEVSTIDWDAGTFNDTHTHDFSAALFVLSGEMSVTTADGKVTCGAGDNFALAAGLPHAERVGAEGVRFLVARK